MPESHVMGSAELPLKEQTIGAAFDETVDRCGGREALVVRHQNLRWTYEELRHEVDRFAAGLLALGLRPGDRVGIWAPNCAEWTVAQFATAKAGLILVNVNPAYRRAELEFCIEKVGCKALISAERFKTSDYLAMLNDLVPELAHADDKTVESKALPQLKHVIRLGEGTTPGCYNFREVAELAGPSHRAQLREIMSTLSPDDAINIQFTSGTTGSPKGATLSHRNILNNGHFVGRALALTESDRICIPVPLYHCFGMVMGNLAAITHGAAMIYPAEGFDPAKTLDAIAEERATALYGVPSMFVVTLECPDLSNRDVTSLRTGIMAGAPCPIEIMKRVVRELHMEDVTICYGMTETSPVSFQTSITDSLERRVSSVGRVHPCIEAKVVDADGRCAETGTPGEILVRGYSVMKGYWNDPEKTRETLDEEGWMHTGDIGVIDEEGYCRITGRIKDMIIRGGENIYPAEIENFLYRHLRIQAVQVFGVPDEKFGEEVCAWIQLKEGAAVNEDQIRDFCSGQIAHYKIPRYIRFVDGFPMTVTGKVQKFAMREQMKRELGLQEQQTA